jgi:hypothetical protein
MWEENTSSTYTDIYLNIDNWILMLRTNVINRYFLCLNIFLITFNFIFLKYICIRAYIDTSMRCSCLNIWYQILKYMLFRRRHICPFYEAVVCPLLCTCNRILKFPFSSTTKIIELSKKKITLIIFQYDQATIMMWTMFYVSKHSSIFEIKHFFKWYDIKNLFTLFSFVSVENSHLNRSL